LANQALQEVTGIWAIDLNQAAIFKKYVHPYRVVVLSANGKRGWEILLAPLIKTYGDGPHRF
jgi:hypothetical protein